jgi:hypothetical protein
LLFASTRYGENRRTLGHSSQLAHYHTTAIRHISCIAKADQTLYYSSKHQQTIPCTTIDLRAWWIIAQGTVEVALETMESVPAVTNEDEKRQVMLEFSFANPGPLNYVIP